MYARPYNTNGTCVTMADGTKTFNLGIGNTKTTAGITKLAGKNGVQATFKNNARNIALNLAKLEAAGAFTKGGYLVITTTSVHIVMPDDTKHELLTFPDYRERSYLIDK